MSNSKKEIVNLDKIDYSSLMNPENRKRIVVKQQNDFSEYHKIIDGLIANFKVEDKPLTNAEICDKIESILHFSFKEKYGDKFLRSDIPLEYLRKNKSLMGLTEIKVKNTIYWEKSQ
jgi:hypothetical protein